jgi:hypothetical protein
MPAKFKINGTVQFDINFSPETVLNSLVIKQDGIVIATDANVLSETYSLPPGDYIASVRFWGAVGTTGTLQVDTPSKVRSRSANISEGSVRETISIGFNL